MSDLQETRQAKRRRNTVLFGCLGVALVLIVLGAGGVWWLISSCFTTDAKEIAALMDEILPGAKVPDGYSGQMGMDMFGDKLVVITPDTVEAEEEDAAAFVTVMVIASTPVDGEKDMGDTLRRKLAERTGAEGQELQDLGTEAITVGGLEVMFQKHVFVRQKGGNQLQYSGTLPQRGGHVTTIMIRGPADKFDRKGMDALLASVAPIGSPPGGAPRQR